MEKVLKYWSYHLKPVIALVSLLNANRKNAPTTLLSSYKVLVLARKECEEVLCAVPAISSQINNT